MALGRGGRRCRGMVREVVVRRRRLRDSWTRLISSLVVEEVAVVEVAAE